MANVEARVAALAMMKPTQIKAAWREAHGSDAPPISTALLARALAHEIQRAGQPGLAERVQRRLAGAGRARPTPVLALGTQLVREWGGTSHHVLVEEKGRCSYDGRSFASLSAVARHITGAHWSGPRFFGVRS